MRKPLHERLWTSIVFIAVIYLIVLVVPQVLLYGAGVKDPLTFTICFVLDALLWLLIVPYFFRLPAGDRSPGRFLEKIGLGPAALQPRYWGLGLLAFAVSFIGFLIPVAVTGNLDPDPAVILPPRSWMLLWGLKAGIFEEIAVRGVILVMLLKKYPAGRALLISSLLFGIGHVFTILLGNPVPDTLVQVIYATLGGLFFGYLFLINGSLLPGILSHYLVDAFLGLLITPLFADNVPFATRSMALIAGYAIAFAMLVGLSVSANIIFQDPSDQISPVKKIFSWRPE